MRGVVLLEFRQLEYFLAVSKLNSFTLAANTLFVTQPTITTAIRSLEDELGIKLFDRSQKRIVLTAEGEVFLTHVQHVMANVSTALSEMNDLKVLGRGFVKIVVSPLLMPNFFPGVYVAFKREFPSLEIHIREESFRTSQKLLDNDEVDFAFMPTPKNTPAIDVIKLLSAKFMLYVSKEHPRARSTICKITDLQDEPLVICGEDSYVQEIISHECTRYACTPKMLYSSNHLASLFGLVASNIGVTILPEQNYHLPDQVTSLPLQPAIQVDFCLANKKNRYLSNAAQTFLNFIKQYNKTEG
jgi:DNA-binding transcriptional LysR family regulator